MDSIVGPAWDLTAAYAGLDSVELSNDVTTIRLLIEELTTKCAVLDVSNPDSTAPNMLAEISRIEAQASVLLGNIGTFANCELTVDGTSPEARAAVAQVRQLSAELSQATAAHSLVLQTCSDDVAAAFLELVPEETFSVQWARRLRAQTLSLAEETLVTTLSVDGHAAWANMYDNISSSLSCDINGESLGIAQASALLSDPDATTRRRAWNAIQAAWKSAEEPAAAVLNAISGWRLSMNKRRGDAAGAPIHFLEPALHSNRMTQATLDAMMGAVADATPIGRRALKLQARALGVEVLHASDLFAPAPPVRSQTKASSNENAATIGMPYDHAIDLIANAVSKVDPSMGDIVRMMAAEGWIEATSGGNKAPGAYCTGFPKEREPRVYLSAYSGSFTNVSTLAHELGHAYHSWVMRDMLLPETHYPMNLAETASIFFETVVADALMEQAAEDPAERFKNGWCEPFVLIRRYDCESAAAFLLNIPSRFDFEVALHEAREKGTISSPDDLSEMMVAAWTGRYGDALQDEMDPMFWASKLHFYMTSPQFYNFPYTFGYLFALGVYAHGENAGDGFHAQYVALLRDTGRMTAEDLVKQHLGVSIEDKSFWARSTAIVERKLDVFEASLAELGL